MGVEEYQRIAFTKLRLSSHNLAIQRGRWTRQPREQRLCQLCDNHEVQDEAHIIERCHSTDGVWTRHSDMNFVVPTFFDYQSPQRLARVCYEPMSSHI